MRKQFLTTQSNVRLDEVKYTETQRGDLLHCSGAEGTKAKEGALSEAVPEQSLERK